MQRSSQVVQRAKKRRGKSTRVRVEFLAPRECKILIHLGDPLTQDRVMLSFDGSEGSRHFSVTPYDKNVDDGLRPTSVPDDGVEQHIDKFWVPHPQTGVFGPSKEIGGENQTQPPPPNLETDADAADGSVLDQKARFRPLEDVDKPIINLE